MASNSPAASRGRDTFEEFMTVRQGKWVRVVLMELEGQVLRFSEIKRRVDGISQKALTQSLRQLERDGFVTRRSFATIPPRVDYELTEVGAEVLVVLGKVEQFMRARWDHIVASRERFDAAAATEPTPVTMVDSREP